LSEDIIICENLVKIYKTKDLEVLALQGLELTIEKGELMAIIGNSGSGKSTFLNMIGGLDRYSAGRLIVDGNLRLDTAGDGTLESAMYAVFGREFVKKMIPVKSVQGDAIAVDGYICRPDNARPKRNYQNFFINGRYINSRTASAALEQAYTSFIAPEKFPCCVLNIKIAPEAVDVNVHPAKLEVKFSNEKPVFEAVYYTVRAALEANVARPDMTLSKGTPVPHPVHAFVPVEQGKAEQTSIDTQVVTSPAKPFERMSAADYKDRMRGFAAGAPTPYTRVEPPRAEAIPLPNLERAAAAVAPNRNPLAPFSPCCAAAYMDMMLFGPGVIRLTNV